MARMVTPYAVQIAPWHLQETDRPAWVRLRREGIGGSDAPGVAGMDERNNRWRVWLSKVRPELDEDPPDDSRIAEMMWFGHAMEDVAAKRFRMRHPGTKTRRVGMLARKDAPWMQVNLDYLVSGCKDGPCILEVKNRSAWTSRDWDTDGDVEKVPDGPVVQSTWGLIVLGGPPAGYSHAHLLAVVGGNELREYTVWWDQGLADTLTGEGEWFWHDHVLPAIPPPVDAAERTGRILARLWDVEEDKIITAGPAEVALIEQLRAAETTAGNAKDAAALIKHELMTVMGDAEILLGKDGRKLATWKQNSTFRADNFRAEQPALAGKYTVQRDAIDTKRLAADDPEMYRRYRSRAFRVAPEPKEGKTK